MRNSARAFMQKIEDAWGVILQRGIPGWAISGQVAGGTLPPAGAGVPYAATAHTHPLSDLEQSGATDGQVVTWSDGAGAYVPATPGGGGGGSLTVTDGTTTVTSVDTLRLPAGTVTDNGGGEAEYVPAGGGGGGDLVLIAEVTPSGTGTVTFSSIPGTYRHLRVVAYGRTSGANDYIYLRVNGDTGSNYDEGRLVNATYGQSSGQTRARIGIFPGSDSESGNAGGWELLIPHYANTTFRKMGTSVGGAEKVDSSVYQRMHTFWWRSTAAITALEFKVDTMNYDAGTIFSLYGMN